MVGDSPFVVESSPFVVESSPFVVDGARPGSYQFLGVCSHPVYGFLRYP